MKREVFLPMIKRAFDILISSIALILLTPIFLFLIFRIRRSLGAPVFFRQIRPGKDGKPFQLIKFRSMRDVNTVDGTPLPDGERLTELGKKLRASSLDELPELWNVLKGEMSLVGPRPLLMEYLQHYTPAQARRMEVRPGITGWAQINGRNAISWEEKFKLDVWYVNNQSLLLDIRILFGTIKKVIAKEGISETGEATMSKFSGGTTGEGQ